jgi:hypothetical protein
MAKKQNTKDILLYGAIGVASAFLVNEIQNFLLWFSFRRESYNLYKAGIEKFGDDFDFWWKVQTTYIDLTNNKITEADAESINANLLALYNPKYEKIVEVERWYIDNCKWLNKPGFFRQRYAYTNYALIVAGIVPLLTEIKSNTLKYILFGGGVVGLFNAIRFNIKAFNIYKLQITNSSIKKLYWDLAKVIDKDFVKASDDTSFAGYILWAIYNIEDKEATADKPETTE